MRVEHRPSSVWHLLQSCKTSYTLQCSNLNIALACSVTFGLSLVPGDEELHLLQRVLSSSDVYTPQHNLSGYTHCEYAVGVYCVILLKHMQQELAVQESDESQDQDEIVLLSMLPTYTQQDMSFCSSRPCWPAWHSLNVLNLLHWSSWQCIAWCRSSLFLACIAQVFHGWHASHRCSSSVVRIISFFVYASPLQGLPT